MLNRLTIIQNSHLEVNVAGGVVNLIVKAHAYTVYEETSDPEAVKDVGNKFVIPITDDSWAAIMEQVQIAKEARDEEYEGHSEPAQGVAEEEFPGSNFGGSNSRGSGGSGGTMSPRPQDEAGNQG